MAPIEADTPETLFETMIAIVENDTALPEIPNVFLGNPHETTIGQYFSHGLMSRQPLTNHTNKLIS